MHAPCVCSTRLTRAPVWRHTSNPARIHAQPHRLLPGRSPPRGKGGHTPGSAIVSPFRVHGALPGEARGAPEGVIDDASQQGSQAPRSRPHEQDGRILYSRPRPDPRQIQTQARTRRRDAVAQDVPAPRPDYAALAGTATRCSRPRPGARGSGGWACSTTTAPTRWRIATSRRWSSKKYKVEGWWSQAVTVGYERIKGLRARGQRRDGSYEANKSRTYNVPVGTLFDAWADARVRGRWLDGEIGRVRTSPPRSRCGSMARTAASSRSASGRRGRRRAPSPCSTPSCAIRRRRRAEGTGPSAWMRSVHVLTP